MCDLPRPDWLCWKFLTCPLRELTRPPYCSLGGARIRPFTSTIVFDIVRPNSWTYESLLKSALLTRLFISRSRSIWSRAGGSFYHSRCLHVSQLFDTTLPSNNITDLTTYLVHIINISLLLHTYLTQNYHSLLPQIHP